MKKVLKWFGYFIAGLLVLSVIGAAFSDDTESDEVEAQAVETEKADAKADAAKAKKAAKATEEKKAESDAKAKEEAKVKAQIDGFSETRDGMVEASSGVITDMDIEHSGVHYKVNVYVNEASWASSSESEKESFATSVGTAIQGTLSDTTLVDFRSALNGDIVAEGKVFGGYKVKR